MREDIMSEFQEDDVARFIKEGITKAVDADTARLDRIERNVIHELEDRQTAAQTAPAVTRERKGLFDWLKLPSLRPAMSLALTASGFVLGVLLAVLFMGSNSLPQDVMFVINYRDAQKVEVMGDFTDWERVSMERGQGGNWFFDIELEPGKYEYVFVVDESKFVHDPQADEFVNISNGHHQNSLIYVK